MEVNEIENQKHCVSVGVELELYSIIRCINEDDNCDFEGKQKNKKQAIKDFIQRYSNTYKKISEEEIKGIVRSKLEKMLSVSENDFGEEQDER